MRTIKKACRGMARANAAFSSPPLLPNGRASCVMQQQCAMKTYVASEYAAERPVLLHAGSAYNKQRELFWGHVDKGRASLWHCAATLVRGHLLPPRCQQGAGCVRRAAGSLNWARLAMDGQRQQQSRARAGGCRSGPALLVCVVSAECGGSAGLRRARHHGRHWWSGPRRP